MKLLVGSDSCQIMCGSESVIDGRYMQSTPYKIYLGTCIFQHGTAVNIEHLITTSALLKL